MMSSAAKPKLGTIQILEAHFLNALNMIVNLGWYVLAAKNDCLGILCRKCVTARAKGGLTAIYLFPSISVYLDGNRSPVGALQNPGSVLQDHNLDTTSSFGTKVDQFGCWIELLIPFIIICLKSETFTLLLSGTKQ